MLMAHTNRTRPEVNLSRLFGENEINRQKQPSLVCWEKSGGQNGKRVGPSVKGRRGTKQPGVVQHKIPSFAEITGRRQKNQNKSRERPAPGETRVFKEKRGKALRPGNGRFRMGFLLGRRKGGAGTWGKKKRRGDQAMPTHKSTPLGSAK